jgi:hypothetical protein
MEAMIATAFIAAKTSEIQLAVAAKMLRMNAQAAASAVKLIDAAQDNMDRMIELATDIGQNLDMSV